MIEVRVVSRLRQTFTLFFFLNYPATTEISPLPLPDALPIFPAPRGGELPRALGLPLLYGVILPWRPRRVARKYRLIWTASGSPLRDLSERLRAELAGSLAQRMLAPLSVELGMLYSAPEVSGALARLRDCGAQRILVLPLFPQYCAATTGAVYDQVSP